MLKPRKDNFPGRALFVHGSPGPSSSYRYRREAARPLAQGMPLLKGSSGKVRPSKSSFIGIHIYIYVYT